MLNKVQLIGNVGADPETRFMPDGTKVVAISVATTERWKNREGNKREHTEWHRVLFYRGLAEVVETYLKEGKQVYVEGKLRTRKWKDKSGLDRYSKEIIGNEMKMVGKKPAEIPDFPEEGEEQDAFVEDM